VLLAQLANAAITGVIGGCGVCGNADRPECGTNICFMGAKLALWSSDCSLKCSPSESITMAGIFGHLAMRSVGVAFLNQVK
jgi:hypothetical protein